MIRAAVGLLLVSFLSMPAGAKDMSLLGREASAYLSDLIRINTVNPPGNERAACDYLAGVLRLAGVPFEIYESTPGRANIVARVKGDGRARPILLLSHLDTVGVDRELWSFDPFSGEEREGYILGRGSIDDKSMTAAFLSVLLHVRRSKTPLARDIIFAATADEESGGNLGVRWLLENVPEVLDAEFAINEGGAIIQKDGKVQMIAVQVAEKKYYDIELVARGASGHASVPYAHNAISQLGRALARMDAWEKPLRLNDAARSYLSGIAALEESPIREALEDVLSDEPERVETGGTTLRRHPYYAALLQDTVVPTMIQGGMRENVVSPEARLNLNVRLLPSSDSEVFLQQLVDVIAEPGISVRIVSEDDDVSSVTTPLEGAMYDAIVRSAAAVASGARVVASMSIGSTDSRYLRHRGVFVYGLEFPLTFSDESRVHGSDEKLPVAGLDFGVRLILKIIEEASAQ